MSRSSKTSKLTGDDYRQFIDSAERLVHHLEQAEEVGKAVFHKLWETPEKAGKKVSFRLLGSLK